VNREQGHVLPGILGAMAVGILLIAPFLSQVSVSLTTSRDYGQSMLAQNSADAGIEHAIWDLVYDDLATQFSSPGDSYNYQMSESVNGKTPDITVTAISMGSGVFGPIDTLAWWKLNDASGLTATDSSGNGYDGTLTNMIGDEWTTGVLGDALQLDGDEDYIELTTFPDLTGNFTMAVWINATDASGDERIFADDENNLGGYALSIGDAGDGQVRFFSRNISPVSLDSGQVITPGTWHHLVGLHDADSQQRRIYVDGQLVAEDSGSYSGIWGIDPGLAALGGEVDGTSESSENWRFDGTMDDFRVYNRVLSEDEIIDLFNEGSGDAPIFQEFTEAKRGSNEQSLTINTPPGTSEDDLLIAAVVTDASETISPPVGEGWTQIDHGTGSNRVTMGVWWKLADASESSSHQFTWGSDEEAYGWIMRFTGHDLSSPINTFGVSSGNNNISPPSPSVTTTVANTLILRIGGFDDDDITVDSTGLVGHTTITMDKSNSGRRDTCAGGAGYVALPAIGASGASNFSLTAREQYRSVTIAIAPEPGDTSSVYDIVSATANSTITARTTITGGTVSIGSWQVE